MKTEIYMRIAPEGASYKYVLKKITDLPLIPEGYRIDDGIVFASKIKTTKETPVQEILVNYEGSVLSKRDDYQISESLKLYLDYEDYA